MIGCSLDIDHLGRDLHVKKIKDNINPNDFLSHLLYIARQMAWHRLVNARCAIQFLAMH